MLYKFSLLFVTLIALMASTSFAAKTKKVSSDQSLKAEPTTTIEVQFLPESKIKLEGDSTLRKYSSTTSDFSLSATVVTQKEVVSGLMWTPKELALSLNVQNLKSGETILDNHMYDNLKAEKHPKITMKLSSFKFSKSEDGQNYLVTASGELNVAGVSKPVELIALMIFEGEKLRIKGKKLLRMTDYEIEPPTMMLGTMVTKNEIEIDFDVVCLTNLKQKGNL